MPTEGISSTFYIFQEQHMIYVLDESLKVSSLSSEDHNKLSCVVTLSYMESLDIQTSNLYVTMPTEGISSTFIFYKSNIWYMYYMNH